MRQDPFERKMPMEIITTHKNVDFDALASVFAASLLYRDAQAVLPKSINQNARAFLALHKDLFPYVGPGEILMGDVTRLVVVDAQSWTRLDGNINPLAEPDMDIHLWDHHTRTGAFKASWSCVENVGAATTLLVNQIEKDQISLSPIEATLFLAGIYEDTGNMSFPSTTARDARAVAFLMDQGGDLSMVKNFLRPAYGPKQKDVLFDMLKNAQREKLDGHTVSLSIMEIEGHVPGLSLVVDMYQDILNVDMAFGIFWERKKDTCLVIGRSTGETADMGAVMRHLGGGGHPNAASALLHKTGPDDARKWIMEFLEGSNSVMVQISDLMSYPVLTVSPDKPMKEVALLLRERGCSGFPVTNGRQVVGIISRRDFKKIRKDKQIEAPVKAFMSTKVRTIGPKNSVMDAVKIMVKEDIGRLPVIENNHLIGLVTRSDTMRYYYNLLPD